jgi:hypothetical protein
METGDGQCIAETPADMLASAPGRMRYDLAAGEAFFALAP